MGQFIRLGRGENMGKRIIETVFHYQIPVLAVLIIISRIAYGCVPRMFPYQVKTSLQILIINVMQATVILSCIIICIFILMAVIYHDMTERNLILDRVRFKRSIPELFRYFSTADPYRMDLRKLPVMSWKEADGVILAKAGSRLIYRPASEGNFDGANFALFALPGGGKTTGQIIPSAMRFPGSVLAIDIKGDIYHSVKHLRRIRIFAPDDPEHSFTFNPLYGIEVMSSTERKVLIEQIAAILVPEDKNGKYFVEGGRDCFCGIALYMLENNVRTTFPDIVRGVLAHDAIYWIKEIYHSECALAQEYTNSYYGTNETNVSGAYGEMRKHVRTLCSDELLELMLPGDNNITPRTLDEGYDVYIELPQHKVEFYSPITTILAQRFMSSFMQRQDKSSGKNLQPVLFLLDEFPQLRFDFKTLSAALSTLRSKSVSVFMAQQSISQLINRYGESAQREIIDTCSYISIMSVQDPKSRQFFQEMIGSRRTLKMTNNISEARDYIKGGSSSRGAVETIEPIFQQGDFANLGDKVIVYAKGKYILAEKTYCFE